MKKLLAMLLAGLLLITSMSVIALADNDENDIDMDEPLDGMLPGLVFYSFSDLFEYIDGLDEDYVSRADEMGFGDGVLEYLYYEMDGFYLLDGVKMEDINSVYVDPRYVDVSFKRGDEFISLYSYIMGESGEEETKKPRALAKNTGVVTTLDSGTEVYYSKYIGSGTYVFVQDGVYYQLINWTNSAYDESMLEYCNASYHYFSEVFELAAEATDSKVKLAWNNLGDDSTYTVYWKRSSSDEWNVACETSKHKVNITGLKSGVSYDFKIEASDIESEVITITAD